MALSSVLSIPQVHNAEQCTDSCGLLLETGVLVMMPDRIRFYSLSCRLLVPALDDQQSQAVHQHGPSLQQHQQPAKLETSDFTAQELDKLMQQRQQRARQFAKQQQKVLSGLTSMLSDLVQLTHIHDIH